MVSRSSQAGPHSRAFVLAVTLLGTLDTNVTLPDHLLGKQLPLTSSNMPPLRLNTIVTRIIWVFFCACVCVCVCLHSNKLPENCTLSCSSQYSACGMVPIRCLVNSVNTR